MKSNHTAPVLAGTEHRTRRPDPQDWLVLAAKAGFRPTMLARLLSCSTRQLYRRCRDCFGCGAREWLDAQRLAAAPELLRKHQSVKTVAFTLGFKQASHFSRRYKIVYGAPPSTVFLSQVGPRCPNRIQNRPQ
jgi:AraC-like DNA-binding protein